MNPFISIGTKIKFNRIELQNDQCTPKRYSKFIKYKKQKKQKQKLEQLQPS